MISSKKIWLLSVLMVLLAPCSLLHAQLIVPKRDLQPVDSLNRTKPAADPGLNTVIKNGYSLISDINGYYRHQHLGRYLSDSLDINRGDYAFWLLDAGDTPVPSPLDSAVRDGWTQIRNGLELVNQNTTYNYGIVQRSFKNTGSSGFMAHSKFLFDSLAYPAMSETYGPFGEWIETTSWDNSINEPFEGGGNLIHKIGFNYDSGSSHYNPSRPGYYWSTEEGYYPGSGNTLWSEFHWEFLDTMQRPIRLISSAAAYDGSLAYFSNTSDRTVVYQSPDLIVGDGLWEDLNYTTGVKDMWYDYHGRINKQYAGTILEKYSNIIEAPTYRNIISQDDDDVFKIGDSSGVKFTNRILFDVEDFVQPIIKSINHYLLFDTVIVDFLGEPVNDRQFLFSSPGVADKMVFGYDGTNYRVGKYNDDENIFMINDDAPNYALNIASNGKLRINMSLGFGGVDFNQFSDDLAGGWMTRDAAQAFYVGNYIDGSDHWVWNFNGSEKYRFKSTGVINAAEYDATPPTGTPFRLIAHETDGDYISASWPQVIDSLIVHGITGSPDSIFAGGPDTLCFVIMGDTSCVPLDSIVIIDGEICFYELGDVVCTGFTTGVVRISDLLGADKPNVIDNANYTQEWRWPTLGNGTGLKLQANGTAASGQAVLKVYQTGGGSGVTTGIDANNTNTGTNTNTAISGFASGASFNFGVAGSVNSGIGVYGSATTGTGVHGTTSSGGVPIRGQWSGSSTNTMERVLDLFRYTDGTAANGIGSYMTFSSQNTGEASGVMTTLASRYVNASYATRTSQFLISGIRSGVDGTYATISGDSITLDTTTFHIDVLNNRVGIHKKNPAFTLDVVGRQGFTDALGNMFWNGGNSTLSGSNNIAIGAGSTNLSLLTTGSENIAMGSAAGFILSSGMRNILIGAVTGNAITTGDSNVCIGYRAGDFLSAANADRNVCIGAAAGKGCNGDNNIFIGTDSGPASNVSNTLFIDNSQTSTPLIKGDFSADSIRFNGIARAKILRDEVIIDGSSTSLSLAVTTSVNIQTLKASGAKTVTLPNATSSTLGYWYKIVNNSTSGDITVSVAGGSSDTVTGDNILSPGESGLWRCVDADLWDKD